MALTFPRDMVPSVRWRHPTLRLMRRQELSRSADGIIQARDLGPALWTADFTSVPLRLPDAAEALADFDTLQGSVNSFYVIPTERPYPISLASAAPLSGASVAVASIRADNAALQLSGCPAGLVLTAGDMISISTDANGLEFHRLARGGTADGAGLTPDLEVTPHVRPLVVVGNTVTLADPRVEMRLDPAGVEETWLDTSHKTLNFKALQVIR